MVESHKKIPKRFPVSGYKKHSAFLSYFFLVCFINSVYKVVVVYFIYINMSLFAVFF